MKKEFFNYLNNIIQSDITYSRAGGGAGSVIVIDLKKDDLEYSLWISCAWRIENKNQIIATSADDAKAVTGLIAKSAKMLEGKVIDSIEISPYYDLRIYFSDGFCLNIFCIFSHTSETDSNWWLAIPDKDLSYEITNNFKIKKGKYN